MHLARNAPRLIIFMDSIRWLLLLLAAPFLLFPNPVRLLALLLLPLIWGTAWLARRESIPTTPLNLSLLLLAIMMLVSLWATYDIQVSLPKITGLLLGLSLFFLYADYGRRKNGWILCLLLFWGSGIAVALVSLVGTQWSSAKIPGLNQIVSWLPVQLSGIAGAEEGFHPNQVAGVLSWVLPSLVMAVVGWLTARGKLNPQTTWWERGAGRLLVGVGLIAGVLLTGLVFVLTQSRSAYLALVFGLGCALWLAAPLRWRWASLAVVLLAAVLAGIMFARNGWPELFNTLQQVSSGSAAFSLLTFDQRLEIWSRAIYALQDFPITGMGMNTFRQVVHLLYPLFSISPTVDIGHAHNEFLQAGLDLGLPGLVAFAALNLGIAIMLFKILRNCHTLPIHPALAKAVVLGLGAGYLAHLLYGLIDAVALGAKPGFIFWMLLGLVAGLHSQVVNAVSAPQTTRQPRIEEG